MRLSILMLLSTCLLLVSACNNAKTETGETISPPSGDEKVFPMSIQKGGTYRSLDQIRVQALSIIQHRIKEEPESLSMLTYVFWTPEFVYNQQNISKTDEYSGYWIKYEDDFTYSYGLGGKTYGKGRYHFRLDDKKLYMLDDNVELEPKVWQINHNADVIALVGLHEYGVNNGMQMKLIGLANKPI